MDFAAFNASFNAEVSDILNQLNTFEFAYKDDPDEGGNKDPQEPLEPQNPQNPNSGNQGNTNTSHADTSVKTGDSTPLLLPLATMCSIIGSSLYANSNVFN